VLRDKDVILMITDPLYGVNYDPSWRDNKGEFKNPKMRGKVK
jgi:hypothetical protein